MAKTLKNVFWGLIITLILGATFCIPSFCNGQNKVFADISEIEFAAGSGWSGNATDGYTGTGDSRLSERKLTLTIIGKGILTFKYTHTAGTFTITCNGNSTTTSTSTAEKTGTLSLNQTGKNTITFAIKKASLFGDNGKVAIKGFSLSREFSSLEGEGTQSSPYKIFTPEDLAEIKYDLTAYYQLQNDIDLSGVSYVPLGSDAAPFSGSFDGNGKKIINLTINSGSNMALFAYTNGGTIKDLSIENANITASSYVSFLIGYAQNGTKINNVLVGGTINSSGAQIGGLVGFAVGQDGVVATDCAVYGNMTTTAAGNIGGLSGSGGNYTRCYVYANIKGIFTVGGLTGGNSNTFSLTNYDVKNSKFTDCYVAGNISVTGKHSNNYPYFGIINGYGSKDKYILSGAGQRVNITYTSTTPVSEIKIFNSNVYPDGLLVDNITTKDGVSTFTTDVPLTGTFAMDGVSFTDLLTGNLETLSDTTTSGITGNYGGLVVRFKMENGLYKYVSTLDRTCATFKGTMNLNLDELTSYEDNFSKIEIVDEGTKTYALSEDVGGVSVWGSAKITNANDFEHLAWLVNGNIPATFTKNGSAVYYNGRSVTTLSVLLDADIDLTAVRKSSNGIVLNTRNGQENGEVIYNFYGFGTSEMNLYRGSIYGQNHTLKVNMDYKNSGAYLMGIIAIASDLDQSIKIKDLIVEGTISGAYRVGIVGMADTCERNLSLEFNNVVNKANISAISLVGGLIGYGQCDYDPNLSTCNGTLPISIINCKNEGKITATSGEAGGFVGSANHMSASKNTSITITNSANYGIISASTAGGLVGNANGVTILGTVSNGGVTIIGSNLCNKYVGAFKNGNTITAEGAILQTIYALNFNLPNQTIIINDASYDTNSQGVVWISFGQNEDIDGQAIKVNSPYLSSAIETTAVNKADGTYHNISIPKEIVFLGGENGEYSTTDESGWEIYARMIYSFGETEDFKVAYTISDEQLASFQLVFENVAVVDESGKYIIPSSLVVTLSRIKNEIKEFLPLAKELLDMQSSNSAEQNQNFKTKGKEVKQEFDNLLQAISAFDNNSDKEKNKQRFLDYISNKITNVLNIEISQETLNSYFDNIVNTEDLSALEDIKIKYEDMEKVFTTQNGEPVENYTFEKELLFTMLNGSKKTLKIAYTFSKNGTLLVEAQTNGVSFSANSVTTYYFANSVNVVIVPMDFTKIELLNAEYVYDGTPKTLTPAFGTKVGDVVNYTLSYNGNAEATNVGEYVVKLEEISGKDAIYYNFPKEEITATLTISKINVAINVVLQSLVYNKTSQTLSYTLEKQSQTTYQLKLTDYVVTYFDETGAKLGDVPTNAGEYKMVFSLTANSQEYIALKGSTEFVYTIGQKQITGVTLKQSTAEYEKREYIIEFDKLNGQIDGDQIGVNYKIYNSQNKESKIIDADKYLVQINSLTNNNYYVDNISLEFVVSKAFVEVTLDGLTSTYGDALNYNNLTYKITDGTLYSGDDLNIVAKPISSISVGTWPLSASYNNDNYDVSIIDANYTILPKEASIIFAENNFTYNGYNQIEELQTSFVGVLDGDIEGFSFELFEKTSQQLTKTTEFKNAGDYVFKLIENQTTQNYTINTIQKEYTIKQFDITLTALDLSKNYGQEITYSMFTTKMPVLKGGDRLEDVVTIAYELYFGTTLISDYANLNYGTYTIKQVLTEKELFNNYNITTNSGTLSILKRNTYIDAFDITKFYNAQPVNFVAYLYTADGEIIENANISYTYYLNGKIVQAPKDVGEYVVTVIAEAGENNKAQSKDYSISILPNAVKIAISNSQPTYNQKAYVPTFTYTMSESVNIDSKISYSFLNEAKEAVASIVNAGKYYVVFDISDKNYQIEKPEISVQVLPIEIEIKVNSRSITFGDDFSLADTTFTLTAGQILPNDNLNLTYTIKEYTQNAGSYVLSAKNNNANYNVKITDGEFVVQKRVLYTSFMGKEKLVYNPVGQEELLCASVDNYISTEAFDVYYTNAINQEVLPQNIINAGEYKLKIKLIDTQNYILEAEGVSEIVKDIVISKQVLVLNIDANGKVYDGQKITKPTIYVADEILSEDLYSLQYFKGETQVLEPTLVGEYQIKVKETDEQNYQFTNNQKTIQIQARVLSINPINTTYLYSRQDIKPQISLENIVTGEDVKADVIYIGENSCFSEVGLYTIKIVGLKGGDYANYELENHNDIQYNIVPVTAEVHIKNINFVYNARQIQEADLNITFACDITILKSDYRLENLPTDAGEHKVAFVGLNGGIVFDINYIDITIQKAEISGIEFNSKTASYNAKQHMLTIQNPQDALGTTFDVVYTNNAHTNAGEYEVTATLSNKNYNEKTLYATLTILQTAVNLAVTTETEFVYNGTSQGPQIIGLDSLWCKELIVYTYSGNETKPTSAGEYEFKITAINPNNIYIQNSTTNFVIKQKAITLINVSPKSCVYAKVPVKYDFTLSGVVGGDEVSATALYNKSQTPPTNAGEYVVTFGSLEGQDALNYYLENKEISTSLTILPYEINVTADSKSIVYGQDNVPLTYTADSLLEGDVFSGELQREQGNNANSYVIKLGTLTAGANYKITYKSGVYSILQRTLEVEDFKESFVYNGEEQVPSIKFTNVLEDDQNVAKVTTEGNTTNAGTYTLKIVVLNINYKIEKTNYTITISKQDISNKIQGLVANSIDYTGQEILPLVQEFGYLYATEYYLNNQKVEKIVNAGQYKIVVSIQDANYLGQKEFDFVVNKINYSQSVLDGAMVEIYSNKLQVLNVQDICVGTTLQDLKCGQIVDNLSEKTTYTLFVQKNESQNYNSTTFNLGEFTTSPSANRLNVEILGLLAKQIDVLDISLIKQIIADEQILAEKERLIFNAENYNQLILNYQQYLNGLEQDIQNIKFASSIVDFNTPEVIAISLSFITPLVFAGVIVARRKKDEK